MGQQQLLLIIIGTIIVGLTIAVSIAQFGTNSQNSTKDAIAGDLYNLAADAYQYKMKPRNLGGGNGKYLGYKISSGFQDNANGHYIVTAVDSNSITFQAESKGYPGNFISQMDSSNGHYGNLDLSKWNPQ